MGTAQLDGAPSACAPQGDLPALVDVPQPFEIWATSPPSGPRRTRDHPHQLRSHRAGGPSRRRSRCGSSCCQEPPEDRFAGQLCWRPLCAPPEGRFAEPGGDSFASELSDNSAGFHSSPACTRVASPSAVCLRNPSPRTTRDALRRDFFLRHTPSPSVGRRQGGSISRQTCLKNL